MYLSHKSIIVELWTYVALVQEGERGDAGVEEIEIKEQGYYRYFQTFI